MRSCISRRSHLQRNCTDGPKKCKWEGKIYRKHHKRLCNFKRVGRFGRRKYCCKHLKICRGLACLRKRKGCRFVGPTYTRTPSSQCKWKRLRKRKKTI